jgi:hypothetical protein
MNAIQYIAFRDELEKISGSVIQGPWSGLPKKNAPARKRLNINRTANRAALGAAALYAYLRWGTEWERKLGEKQKARRNK